MARPNPWWIAPLLVLAGAIALVMQRTEVPERADWQSAASAIRADLQPGDAVAWAPYWAGEARLVLHDLPGVHLLDLPTADLARWDRLWLMSGWGADADDLTWPHAVLKRQSMGPVTLDLVQIKGAKVVGDLYADLEQAQVDQRPDRGTNKRCDFWDGRGWHCSLRKSPDKTRACLAQSTKTRHRTRKRDPSCGLDRWMHVSRDVRVIGEGPRRCIWLHPKARATVALTWPTAPAGDSLVLDYGFTDKVISDNTLPKPRTEPITLKVFRGQALVGEKQIDPIKGWHRWTMPLRAEMGARPLRFEVRSAGKTTDAHFCFDPTVRIGSRP
jgi:hypothetical protein